MRLLLGDDDHEVRVTTCMLLEHYGHAVIRSTATYGVRFPSLGVLPGAMKQEYSVHHLPSLLHAMGRSTSFGTSRSSSDLHVRQTYVSIAPSAMTRVRRSRSARWGTASAEESRHREHSRQ